MRTASAPPIAPRRDAPFEPRIHVSAISELSAGRDQQLGQIFHNMRLVMKITREALARRLATTPMVIDSFEAGAITALPHWKETARIVRGYCELLRLDPEPILWRIQSQLQSVAGSAGPVSRTAHVAPPRVLAPASTTKSAASAKRTKPRRRARMALAVSAPIALIAMGAYLLQIAPQPAYQAIGVLPAGIAKPVRTVVDFLVLATAPSRDGLRWVELGDPRLRKADKLQTGRQ